ncbi:MAG: class I tRNA ligase family protein, partial [Christensenellales bacterium]
FDTELINKMLPVDKYIGGAEHACMHLLYARFITKALKDMGYINFDEPFLSLVHQGTILGPDGNKMSKSRGNVVSPDDCIQKYSSDIFRLYLMFCFSYVEGGPWNESGLEGIQRFLDRVERLTAKADDKFNDNPFGKEEKELNFVRNNTVKLMTENIKAFSFNTAIARLMEFVNAMYNYDKVVQDKNKLFYACVKDIVLLIAPLAPHFAEELNERLGGEYSVFNQPYPTYDEKALVLDEVELAIQVNSKIKGKVTVSKDASNEEIEKAAKEVIASQLEGVTVKKAIIIKGRIINFIV